MTPTRPVAPRPPPTLTVREVCPCGATYVSGRTKCPEVWEAWVAVHVRHGFVEGER